MVIYKESLMLACEVEVSAYVLLPVLAVETISI